MIIPIAGIAEAIGEAGNYTDFFALQREQQLRAAARRSADAADQWRAKARALEGERDRLLADYNILVNEYNRLGTYAKSKGIVR